jgi:hypothetical protein
MANSKIGLPELGNWSQFAMEVLSRVTERLVREGFTVDKDNTYPYHIIISKLSYQSTRYSVFCGGFTPQIDVLRLTRKGTGDQRCTETSYNGSGNLNRLVKFLEKQPW